MEEAKILMLHGVLHLAGHDHAHDSGEMQRLEEKLRRQLKLPPSLTERAQGATR
jgi:probable rRNA maturation factor